MVGRNVERFQIQSDALGVRKFDTVEQRVVHFAVRLFNFKNFDGM